MSLAQPRCQCECVPATVCLFVCVCVCVGGGGGVCVCVCGLHSCNNLFLLYLMLYVKHINRTVLNKYH